MKFRIQKEVLNKISMPYSVAFVVVANVSLQEGAEEKLKMELEQVVEPKFKSIEIEKNPTVLAYRQVLSELGIEAKVSLETLAAIIKKKSVVMDSPVINAYNKFVLENMVPAGGYDLDRVVGDVEIRLSKVGDRFKQLGKEDYSEFSPESPVTVVLADQEEVLCNDWVSKQSETQKIRSTSKNFMFRLEGLGLTAQEMKEFTAIFVVDFSDYFQFDFVKTVILDENTTGDEIELPSEVEVRRANYVDAVELLTRGVSKVIVYEDVLQSLMDGKKLRIKHGVDPTTKDLHLGYAVNYEKMRQFQDRGHTIIFLIGSFTARFGDPTDKGETRTMKDKQIVMDLAQNYIKQLSRILDIDKLEIRYNGDWFDEMKAEDLLRIMSEFTVARMLERDMFTKRMKEGKEIGLHEIVYPMLQGYDSVEIESDLTVIGTDQTFNELQARPLQSRRGQTPQNIIAMELLVGTDGKMKMSQSLGNYIGFDDTPEDKFGKIMSIPDSLIMPYFTSSTRVSRQELAEIKSLLESGVNPRDIKFRLAKEIISVFDGETAAEKAKLHFETVFQKKELPDDIVSFELSADMSLVQVLVESKMASSNAEVRRLVEQGGVKLDSEKVTDFQMLLPKDGVERILQVGKRKFLRVS